MPTGMKLTIAVMLCLVITSSASYAYKFGDFPGKGSHQVWKQANDWFNKGLRFSRTEEFDEAIQSIQQAIKIYPYDPGYFYDLAICYESRNKPGDLQRAEGSYRTSIKLAPHVWESWNGLASPLFSLRRFSEAKAAKEEAMRNNPPKEEALTIQEDIVTISKKMQSVSRGR